MVGREVYNGYKRVYIQCLFLLEHGTSWFKAVTLLFLFWRVPVLIPVSISTALIEVSRCLNY